MAGSIPFVSVRKHIKWGDNPAGENTDTLVLTTPLKNYVDVRIYLPSSTTQSSLPIPQSLPSSRLEWAFAGPSLSTPSTSTAPAHTIWTHWVDSKTTEQVQDEGDMYPQPNGEVMEYGKMVNPGTGREEKYEECWVDLHLEGEKKGWFLKAEADGGKTKGMLARIGGYIQGVLRKGEGISVGRWNIGVEETWEKVVEIGEIDLPQVGKDLKKGDVLTTGDGLSWECVETF